MTPQPDPLHIDFHLLDRQIVDADGALLGNVDDVELTADADGVLHVSALLVGQRVLGARIGGWLGRWMTAVGTRLADREPLRIPYEQVAEVTSEVRLTVTIDQLPDLPLEEWLRDHLIGRIPGADREG